MFGSVNAHTKSFFSAQLIYAHSVFFVLLIHSIQAIIVEKWSVLENNFELDCIINVIFTITCTTLSEAKTVEWIYSYTKKTKHQFVYTLESALNFLIIIISAEMKGNSFQSRRFGSHLQVPLSECIPPTLKRCGVVPVVNSYAPPGIHITSATNEGSDEAMEAEQEKYLDNCWVTPAENCE